MTLVPGWDFRGTAPFGSLANGDVFRPFTPQASGPCPALGTTTGARCLILQWTAGQSAYDQQRGAGDRIVWHGSLLEGKRDQVGFDYRRNRVYDPATGRFTQQDPIGLAGGINSYGFAGGDPVNFSDPFGDTVRVIGRGANDVVARALADEVFRKLFSDLNASVRNFDIVSADVVPSDEVWNMKDTGLGRWRGFSWFPAPLISPMP